MTENSCSGCGSSLLANYSKPLLPAGCCNAIGDFAKLYSLSGYLVTGYSEGRI